LLEDKLRHARTLLLQLKVKNGSPLDGDIDAAIQALECKVVPMQDGAMSIVEPSYNQHTVDHFGGPGQSVARGRNSEAFFGASSGFSFVCRTLKLFLQDLDSSTSTANIQCAILDLFDRPIPEKWKLQNCHQKPPSLPERATSLRLLQSLFARCSLVAQFLQESDLRQTVDRIDHPALPHRDAHSDQMFMLLHAVLALGYLYNVPLHRAEGCRATTAEAYVPSFTTEIFV
jgi:hypothetical protein